MCSCSSGIETTIHFFLHCANFNIQRQTLFDKITTIEANNLTENEYSIVNALLFGKPNSENSFKKHQKEDLVGPTQLYPTRINGSYAIHSYYFLYGLSAPKLSLEMKHDSSRNKDDGN